MQLLEEQENLAALRAALGRLGESSRCVLELAVYQQLPYAEISSILDIPIGTVKSRVHHAVLSLKELLGAGDGAHWHSQAQCRWPRRWPRCLTELLTCLHLNLQNSCNR